MPKASPIRSSFNGGELSPLLDGRVDVAKYQAGCRVLENFLPTVQGPVIRRPGSVFVASAKSSTGNTFLVPFIFNNTQCYVLEFGNLYIRFYYQHGQILSGGVPYEIVTPFTSADLQNADGTFALNFVQSGDVVYIAHPAHFPQKLSRLGHTSWTIADASLKGGPFGPRNTDKTYQFVSASASSGTVTLQPSGLANIFDTPDVGCLFYMELSNGYPLPWTAGQEWTTNPFGDYRISDGSIYKCSTNGVPTAGKVWRTGGEKPIHLSGTQRDGAGKALIGTSVEREGLDWDYVGSTYVWLKITAVNTGVSPATATATVLSDWSIPSGMISPAGTWRWAKGAFKPGDYPSCVTFFRERLTFAKGQTIYCSCSADFENFMPYDETGTVVADRAITVTLSTDQPQKIQWIVPQQALLVGTAGAEFAVSENSTNEAFAPGNVKCEQQTSEGSNGARPASVGFATLFATRSGRKLLESAYNFQQNGYVTKDMTVLAEHIANAGLGIIQTVWQREPYRVLWCVRGDGQLLGFTYNTEQDVVCWHRHPMANAQVLSVAVIPTPDGTRDQLWMVVQRTIGGVSKRYIEYLAPEYLSGASLTTAVYADCSITQTFGSPVTSISGLDWLEGATVRILADGSVHPDRTVYLGSITLQRAATTVTIGLGYDSILQTNRIEAGAADGTAQGKTKRIFKAVFRFCNTVGAKVGPDTATLDEIQFRSPSDPMDAPPSVFTGDKLVEWPNGYDFDGYITVVQDQPLPMTVVAIMPQVHTFDR